MRVLAANVISGLLSGALLVSCILSSTPAAANDSVAEMAAGGLVLGRSDTISIEEETLYLSMERVQVDYVFRNNGAEDVETIVAFPMPDIVFSAHGDMAIPVMADNFLGFTVEVDGAIVEPQLQQRAVAAGIDITDRVIAAGLPVVPLSESGSEMEISGVDASDLAALQAAGALELVTDYETGKPAGTAYPLWTVQSAYWWRMVFPANTDVAVRHRYTPALGATTGVYFPTEGEGGQTLARYEQRYCMDTPFVDGVRRKLEQAQSAGGPHYTEATLSYVLTTGANWAGPIGSFRLIVDKGSADNLVSFCGTGVEKTGPTTFELVYEDFWPERDLDVLFIVAHR